MDLKGPQHRRSTAIKALAPNCSWHSESDGTIIEWLSADIPQPSEADIDAKVAEYKIEYDAQAYARNRKVEYDVLNQLELQFDDQANDTTTWVDAIEAIKAKYPKP